MASSVCPGPSSGLGFRSLASIGFFRSHVRQHLRQQRDTGAAHGFWSIRPETWTALHFSGVLCACCVLSCTVLKGLSVDANAFASGTALDGDAAPFESQPWPAPAALQWSRRLLFELPKTARRALIIMALHDLWDQWEQTNNVLLLELTTHPPVNCPHSFLLAVPGLMACAFPLSRVANIGKCSGQRASTIYSLARLNGCNWPRPIYKRDSRFREAQEEGMSWHVLTPMSGEQEWRWRNLDPCSDNCAGSWLEPKPQRFELRSTASVNSRS